MLWRKLNIGQGKWVRKWKSLLNPMRFRKSTSTSSRHWIPFDSDYSRVSLSAPFRRLQDKAQVFPFDDNDFVRTRLTHSIEVSGIARSLGVGLENHLIKTKELDTNKCGHIPSILSVAGLAHDIGNPPFGHFGEYSIQNFFATHRDTIKDLTSLEQNDLLNFDGNVQGLRLLLRLGNTSKPESYNLTFPVLAAIIKYPHDSITGNKKGRDLGVSYKKFGFFQTEKDKYKKIDNVLGLNNRRHPLCYLLEAADDICYSVSDIEDGIKKKTITLDYLIDKLDDHRHDDYCKDMHETIKHMRKENPKTRLYEQVIAQECRIFAQQKMTNSALESFKDHYDGIMDGGFDSELLYKSDSKELLLFFKDIAKKNFADKSILKRELAGDMVIKFLLEKFITASCSENRDLRTEDGKLYELIPDQFKKAQTDTPYHNKKFLNILLATDFICSMTDSYALSLYNELRGA